MAGNGQERAEAPQRHSAQRRPTVVTGVVVGVISDTHGDLYPEVKKALEGVDHIIHAGDIGSPRVLADLGQIAPVTAVRGNCDYEQWAQDLPLHTALFVGGARIAVGHVARGVERWAEAAGETEAAPAFDVIIFGHSHMALVEQEGPVLRLNPGSAGPKRFNRPRSLARLTIWPPTAGDAGDRPRMHAQILTFD